VRELVDPLLGIIPFFIMCGFDMASLASLAVLKRVALCVASVLFLFASVRVPMHPENLPLPTWCVPMGWLLSILGGILLVYSLALEIPFQRTYLTPGASSELVTTATYALTRHPGVLWLALLLVGLLLVSRSRAMLIAAPTWLLMDIRKRVRWPPSSPP
jgi:protein-S-isoprenylcysteine O-methyltransferase Ste14